MLFRGFGSTTLQPIRLELADSMLAGLATALAAGAHPVKAAELGNLVAGVTVRKLLQTGTASPEEILDIGSDPEYLPCE